MSVGGSERQLEFPGSAVILIGVATSRGDIGRAVGIVSIVTIAFLLTTQINYALGYFGLHGLVVRLGGGKMLRRSQDRYQKFGAVILPPSFFHPSLGGFMAVACGMARLPWKRFATITGLSVVAWNIFWGIVAYLFADVVSEVATRPVVVLAALCIWTAAAFVLGFIHSGPSNHGRSTAASEEEDGDEAAG